MIDDDVPKSLRSVTCLNARRAAIDAPHVAPLAAFVQQLRVDMGAGYAIPDFDPLDGGVFADRLFLLEAPGPKAVASGFVSRNNPDETAKNFLLLNLEAGIDRSRTVIWNVVPWYIGSGSRIRAASIRDLGAARPALAKLMGLLPRLRFVVLVGRKAEWAKDAVQQLAPSAMLFSMPHPSPLFINRRPENRKRVLAALRLVADSMSTQG